MTSYWKFFLLLFAILNQNVFASSFDSEYRKFSSEQKRIAQLDLKSTKLDELRLKNYLIFKKNLRIKGSFSKIFDDDLITYFKAADEISFYTSRASQAHELSEIVNELKIRNISDIESIRKVYYSLIASREYDFARKWRVKYSLETSPFEMLKKQDKPNNLKNIYTGLQFTSHGVSKVKFSLPETGYVIAIVHPLCHFSRYAIEQINSDPSLEKSLSGKIRWLSPQQRETDHQIFLDWNKLYPSHEIFQIYNSNEWPSIENWETPIFYFFYNGSIRHVITGWPENGHIVDFKYGLRKILIFDE